MLNSWDPRTGRTPKYAIWWDELGDVLVHLGLSVDHIDEPPPEEPIEATYDAYAYGLWADAARQYQDEGTRIFDAVRKSLIHCALRSLHGDGPADHLADEAQVRK